MLDYTTESANETNIKRQIIKGDGKVSFYGGTFCNKKGKRVS